MLCPSCGKTIPDGSTSCSCCGTKLPSGKAKVAALIPYRKGRRWGFCNQGGDMAIPAIYDNVDDFCEGLARVKLNGEYGYIDDKGDMVIPAMFDGAGSFAGITMSPLSSM